MIEVLSSLPLNTVQDLGRKGQRHIGVSTAGAMDAPALALGNCMVGNEPEAAGIEVQTFPFELRFLADLRFAITGANAEATLDGRVVMPWWTRAAREGQVLRLNYPAQGARVYLAFQGGIAVPRILGSRSTDVRSGFGGFEGRFLKRDDRLPLSSVGEQGRAREFGVLPPATALAIGAPDQDIVRVRALRAGEYDRFPVAVQRTFWQSSWHITHQSDRAGYRFSGPKLSTDSHIEMRSYGVVPGLIQVPPGGQPIVQLSDANTAGGYPKIATVIEADLWRLGQARAGDKVMFIDCTYREALEAKAALDAYLARVRREIRLAQYQPDEAVAP